MSVSTEVQRTLVKSPPELWSELSNPEALARHLADLGAIRITGVEPETRVEWESEIASGVVHLKQSGWGTKVTLSVTRAAPAEERPEHQALPEPEPLAAPRPAPERASDAPPQHASDPAAGPEPEPTAGYGPATETVAVEASPDPLADPEPEPRRRLFARLFRRRRARADAVLETESEPDACAEPKPEIEIVALAAPEPSYPERPLEPAVDLAAELDSVEAQMDQETAELLTGVLDRLGAAHHRPFSRG